MTVISQGIHNTAFASLKIIPALPQPNPRLRKFNGNLSEI